MAKRLSKRRSNRDLRVVHPDAAAIDVGARFHVVAVAATCDPEPVRTFRAFTNDLHRLADWLEQVGVTTVAMESTGVYWLRVPVDCDHRFQGNATTDSGRTRPPRR